MSEHSVTIRLSDSTYERLQEVAEASDWSVEEVVLRTIKAGMPPSLIKVPEKYHGELLKLNKLDDQDLWEAGQDQPGAEDDAGIGLLRRAYAYALLKWRGHPLPDPSEFLL